MSFNIMVVLTKALKDGIFLYQSDINQFSGVLNHYESAGVGNSIATILVGPFTNLQRMKVKEQSIVAQSALETPYSG